MLKFFDNARPERDVVVSGVGTVTAWGNNVDHLWQALCQQRQAVRHLSDSEIEHRASLTEFLRTSPAAAIVNHGETRETLHQDLPSDPLSHATANTFDFDPVNTMAMLATLRAVCDAGLELKELRTMPSGCIIGTSKPSLRSVEEFFRQDKLPSANNLANTDRSGALFQNGFLPDACQRACSALVDAKEVGFCPVAACATGLLAVLQGALLIHQGQIDLCVVGSADASARASVIAAFHRLGVLSRHADAGSGCRPFDIHRDGFHIGEGAGVLILESAAHAEARGQKSYGRLTHGAWATDTTGLTQVDESGTGVERVLRQMESSTKTDLCSLHGTGTIPNDACEIAGIRRFFGTQLPHLFGIKGSIGHLLGAAGSVELIVGLKSLNEARFLPTTNLNHPIEGTGGSFPTKPVIQRSARSLTKLSLGFGGHVVGCRAELCSPP